MVVGSYMTNFLFSLKHQSNDITFHVTRQSNLTYLPKVPLKTGFFLIAIRLTRRPSTHDNDF